ncbi:hypothetical protein [Viridibacillus arvi]|uniref:hypothetical protein n=1 Tax=Viridibacillus arvi TaxID=263475 RepID=UPI0034CF9F65
MKIDRDIIKLERSIAKSDFILARKIIENDLNKFLSPTVRKELSLEALSLVNSIVELNQDDNKEVYSRKTQLIVQHINKLAYNGQFQDLRRYCSLHEDLISNPKIYNILSADVKIIIPDPSKVAIVANT